MSQIERKKQIIRYGIFSSIDNKNYSRNVNVLKLRNIFVVILSWIFFFFSEL